MIRSAITLAALALLAGCEPSERAPEVTTSAGTGYSVARLFTHDGCTVYRFYDKWRDRYFARCDGAVSSDASWVDRVQCGKAQCDEPHSVPTARGKERP